MAVVSFVVAKEDEDWVDLSWTSTELLPVQNTFALGMSRISEHPWTMFSEVVTSCLYLIGEQFACVLTCLPLSMQDMLDPLRCDYTYQDHNSMYDQ